MLDQDAPLGARPDALLDDAARQRLAGRWGSRAGPWLAALPGLAADCCRRWDLTLDRAMPGGTAAVFAGRAAGRPVVLKLMPDPAIAAGEAAALRAWAATPHAAGLLAADEPSGALLLEFVPGTLVSAAPRLPPAAAVAALLRGLRDVPPGAAAGLAPLAGRVDFMYDLAERHRVSRPAGPWFRAALWFWSAPSCQPAWCDVATPPPGRWPTAGRTGWCTATCTRPTCWRPGRTGPGGHRPASEPGRPGPRRRGLRADPGDQRPAGPRPDPAAAPAWCPAWTRTGPGAGAPPSPCSTP